MEDLEFVLTYIAELLVITNGTFEDHREKLSCIFTKLQNAGLKVNIKKSFFAKNSLEYLGYWITQEGTQPVANKVHAIANVAAPKTK